MAKKTTVWGIVTEGLGDIVGSAAKDVGKAGYSIGKEIIRQTTGLNFSKKKDHRIKTKCGTITIKFQK